MNRHQTEQTLIEQMRINDIEIARRMELFGIGEEQFEILKGCGHVIRKNIDAIVDEFYEKQVADEEISHLIGDADTLARLHRVQREYVLNLFSGDYDVEYVNNRLRIGLVHKRIGVEPKLYLSAVKTLKNIIIKHLFMELPDVERREAVREALDRLIYFDVTLVFDTYIRSLVSEIEIARGRTESYARSLEKKVTERTRQLEEVARRDALTGLYNRRALQELLQRQFALARRQSHHISFVFIDIDNFKQINDRFGHHLGDEVLTRIGGILLEITRETDIPCRCGGDEFCILLVDCDRDGAQKICRRLIDEFTATFPDFTLSVGIATTGTEEFEEPQDLMRRADHLMYAAKEETGTHIVS